MKEKAGIRTNKRLFRLPDGFGLMKAGQKASVLLMFGYLTVYP